MGCFYIIIYYNLFYRLCQPKKAKIKGILKLNGKSAVNSYHLSRNEGCLVRRKKLCKVCHLLGATYATQGRFIGKLTENLIRKGSVHIGGYNPGLNAVYGNSRGTEFFCERRRKPSQSRL